MMNIVNWLIDKTISVIEGAREFVKELPEKLKSFILKKWSDFRAGFGKYQIIQLLFFIGTTMLSSAFFRIWRVRNYGIQDVIYLMDIVNETFSNPWPPYSKGDLLKGCMLSGSLLLFMIVYRDTRKVTRSKKEFGSARWGRKRDIAPFVDPLPERNIILTATEQITISNRPKIPKYARNNNVLVLGSSGSGKTRFFLKPNLLQMHSSYVITDPKGTLITECGHVLEMNGYQIKAFNTINFRKSMHYNPFAYIRRQEDIATLVTVLMENTKVEGAKSGDEFWQSAERLLYTALIAYLHYKAPKEEQNFAMLIDMVNEMEVREEDETFTNKIDDLFKELAEEQPDCFPVRQYKAFKLAAGKTAKSILISCSARLSRLDIDAIREITEYDELGLDTLGDRKQALFLIMSDTNKTFNFLVGMIYTQLFNALCLKADDFYGGRLPIHVRCLIDEAANIGRIPELETLITTIRSREISACLIFQTKSQIKAIYKDHAETIAGNCDSQLFLGGNEESTLKSLSQALGKETIDVENSGNQRGKESTITQNFSKQGRELLAMDEIAVMDRGKCILQLSGVYPFYSDKYDLTKHPNYKYTSDFDGRNAFDIMKYRRRRMKLRGNDQYLVINLGKNVI